MVLLTRFCLLLLVLPLLPLRAAHAQDAGMQAAQMATDAAQQAAQISQQASQQAIDDMQRASQQAQQDMQQAVQNSQNQYSGPPQAAKPAFSMKPGKYPSTITVRMKDKTRFANIYYTTDGWTPTEHSTLYAGPLTLTSTAFLQAIAVAPQHVWSSIASGMYTINGAPFDPCNSPSASDSAAPDSATAIPLMFTSQVSSAKAEIGDSFPLIVARDVEVGDRVLARKGTPAIATVTQVNSSGLNAKPGVLTFQVKSLDANGKTIPLRGVDSKEAPGVNRTPFYVLMFVPFAGPVIGASSLLVHGNNAIIQPGTCITAYMDENALSASGK